MLTDHITHTDALQQSIERLREALENIQSRWGSVCGVPVDSEACSVYANTLQEVLDEAGAALEADGHDPA